MISPQRSTAVIGLAAFLALSGIAVAWQLILATRIDQPRIGAAVSIVSQLNFRYDAKFIWSTLVTARGFQSLAGCSIDVWEPDKAIEKIGESFPATISDDKGQWIVTTFDNGRELRLVFEPHGAQYVIHKRFNVATAGNGCVLQYWSTFTDFGPEVDERAKREHEAIAAAADKFRALVESLVKPNTPVHGH